MARSKQSILKRDEQHNVVYDHDGRPVVDRVVKASRSDFKRPKPSKSGPITTRTMSDEERRECYAPAARFMTKEERRRVGLGVGLMTDEERARYGY